MNLLKILKILIVILIIGIIYYIYKIIYNIEKFKNKSINFLTKEKTQMFIMNDKDNYIKNLTNLDLYARKVKSKEIYKNKSINCCANFTEKQIIEIKKGIIEADNYLKNYNKLLNGNDISKMNWNFALTKNNNNFEYEDGLPHTRDNIIFLSDKMIPNEINNSFINTLIHEKIHIYQRYNPKILENIIKKMGYIKTNLKNIKQRSNPDLNKYIYINKNNEKLVCLYKNNKPNSINDVNCLNNNNLLEHPYELIAYNIANNYNNLEIKKYKNNI